MKQYHKIENVFYRSDETHRYMLWEWRLPVFEYLRDCAWTLTEKVDGTNIRVMWDGETVKFAGKTDRAQIPPKLLERLEYLFTPEKFGDSTPMCLYGEGYGAKIQKGGGNYLSDSVDFVLFDVLIGEWWLERLNVLDIAHSFGCDAVPVVGCTSLVEAVRMAQEGFNSCWGDFPAEGLVCRPAIGLKDRAGRRIITKIKTKDFAKDE